MSESEEKAIKREEMRLMRERNELLAVLQGANGRHLLWRIISMCGVYRSPEGDTNNQMKCIGKQDLGRQLLGIVGDANEDALFKMMSESRARQQEEDLKISVEDSLDEEEEENKHLSTMI